MYNVHTKADSFRVLKGFNLKLTFTSVELDKLGRNKDGAWATFSATLNQAVLEKMEWTEAPECFTGGKLEGEIACISLELIPNESDRKGIELELARLVRFETKRKELKESRGKGHRTELWFKVICQDMKGAGKLENYKMSNVGKSKLIVSFEKTAKQEDLPGAEEDTGCIACNNGVPLMEDNPKKHQNNRKCTRTAVQEDLPVQ